MLWMRDEESLGNPPLFCFRFAQKGVTSDAVTAATFPSTCFALRLATSSRPPMYFGLRKRYYLWTIAQLPLPKGSPSFCISDVLK